MGCGAHCVVRKDETATVAVKYYGGDDASERLAREVRRLKQLDEGRIIAYGSDEGRCLLASPLYEDALADHVCGLCSRAAPAGAVARIIVDIAQALAHAHSLGIVHGDVKPANVVERIVVLGLQASPKAVAVAGRAVDFSWTAGALTIRRPDLPMAGAWAVDFTF